MGRIVVFGMLKERVIGEHAVNAYADIAQRAGAMGLLASLRRTSSRSELGNLRHMGKGNAVGQFLSLLDRLDITDFGHIGIGYLRTDIARNTYCAQFLKIAKNPKDTLIMLDADHRHPDDTLERLLAHDVGVVGALAFRRGAPFFPCVFAKNPDGPGYALPTHWEPGLAECAIVGTGAIAIQKWVLDKLLAAGYGPRFFKYTYDVPTVDSSEDIYFGQNCERLGIPHYCDMSLESPHLTVSDITSRDWFNWCARHPNEQVIDPAIFGVMGANPDPKAAETEAFNPAALIAEAVA